MSPHGAQTRLSLSLQPDAPAQQRQVSFENFDSMSEDSFEVLCPHASENCKRFLSMRSSYRQREKYHSSTHGSHRNNLRRGLPAHKSCAFRQKAITGGLTSTEVTFGLGRRGISHREAAMTPIVNVRSATRRRMDQRIRRLGALFLPNRCRILNTSSPITTEDSPLRI